MSFMSSDICNAWAYYWAPEGTDRFGAPSYLPPVAIQVNWRDGINRVLEADGVTFSINNSVVSATEMKKGGVLMKADCNPRETGETLYPPSTIEPPREGIIKAVTNQADFDNPNDYVYTAMI